MEAEKCLSNALSEVKKVIQLIDSVLNYVPFEIFGGPIIDEEQVAYLEGNRECDGRCILTFIQLQRKRSGQFKNYLMLHVLHCLKSHTHKL